MSVAKEVLKARDFMFTFDFKSGYHHVDLFPQDRKYLKVASLQVHVDLLKSGFLPNKAKCIWKPNEALRSLLGSEPFSTLPLLNFLPLTSGLPVYKEDFANRLAISSSCHPVRSLPPFAEKSYICWLLRWKCLCSHQYRAYLELLRSSFV